MIEALDIGAGGERGLFHAAKVLPSDAESSWTARFSVASTTWPNLAGSPVSAWRELQRRDHEAGDGRMASDNIRSPIDRQMAYAVAVDTVAPNRSPQGNSLL